MIFPIEYPIINLMEIMKYMDFFLIIAHLECNKDRDIKE